MKELVFLEPNNINSEPFTTSDVVAKSAKLQHHTVTKLIQTHESDIKEFGILRFEIEEIKGRGQPAKHYHLNEQQATLLITYLKNTEPVRKFKKALVKEFYEMRAELMKRQTYRLELKPIRREMTDVIKEVDESRWAYKKYTDLAYKAAIGKNASQLRKERDAEPKAVAVDFMTSEEINSITKAQNQIAVLLEMGMDYQQVKLMMLNRKFIGAVAGKTA